MFPREQQEDMSETTLLIFYKNARNHVHDHFSWEKS